jgi:hypothetical protein
MSEILNVIDIEKLERPILAIVRLAPENKEKRDMAGVLTPFYQVTIDPANLSPTKEFIRFGKVHGDEIMGWRPVEDVVVEEVMGEYEDGCAPPLISPPQAGNEIRLRPFGQKLLAAA